MIASVVVLAFAGLPYEAAPVQRRAAPTLTTGASSAGVAHTIFVNFDGATITDGAFRDDATIDETALPGYGGEWPPFGDSPGSAERTAILQAIGVDFDAFGVTITDTRPQDGVYTMVIVSPRNSGTSQLGVANVMCGAEGRAGVAFTFIGAGDRDTATVASTVSHEAAHTLGLEHVDANTEIMAPTYMGGDPQFGDGCAPLVPGETLCPDFHAQHCDAGAQNGHAELLAAFGDGTVDNDAPALVITAPDDGGRVASGSDFEVTVEGEDDLGIAQVRLYLDDELVGTKTSAPFVWEMDPIDDGVHELRASGQDVAGNDAESEVVTFAVGDVELPDDDDSGEGSDDGSGGAGSGLVPGSGGGDEGCACAADRRDTPASCLILALLALSSRRDRRRVGARGTIHPWTRPSARSWTRWRDAMPTSRGWHGRRLRRSSLAR